MNPNENNSDNQSQDLVESQDLDLTQNDTPDNEDSASLAGSPQQHDENYGDGTQQPSRDEIVENRAIGKLQQEQEARKKLERELQQARNNLQRLETIEKRAMESPDKFKRALVDYSGWSEQDAAAYVQQLEAQGAWQQRQQQQQQQQGYGQQPPQPTINPYQAAEQVFQAKMRAQQVQSAFFNRVPELDPKNLKPEQLAGAREFATAIEREATRRVQENPSNDFVETLVQVHSEWTGKSQDEINAARETGRAEGMLTANSQSAATSRASKGRTPSDGNHGLSADEMRQADLEGLSYKDFARLKDPVAEVQ